MRRWLVLGLLALAGAVEAQPLTGGLLGRGATYGSFVPPAGATTGCVGLFLGSPLALGCSDVVYTVADKSLDVTDGRVQAANLKAIPLDAPTGLTVTPVLSKVASVTTVAGSARATGLLTVPAAASLSDTETFSIHDGSTQQGFEFDTNAAVVNPGFLPVDLSGLTSPEDVAAACASAINGATGVGWTVEAIDNLDGTVTLRNTVPGVAGTAANAEAVTDAGFILTNMAGGADGIVDGDYLTVEYGPGLTVPIEFDVSPGDGTTGGRVPYVFTEGETADSIRDGLIVILNGAAPAALTASSGGAATVALVLDTPGAVGGTLSENVTDGNFAVAGFADPAAATTVTYRVLACLASGDCNLGSVATTLTSPATLSTDDFLRLAWDEVTGAASYEVWRTVAPTSPATTGLVWYGTALTIDDTGLAGDGASEPTVDHTGRATVGGLTYSGGSTTGQVVTCDADGNCWPQAAAGGITNAATTNVIPKTDAGGNLIASNLSDSGTAVTSAVPVIVPDGTAAAPGLAFAGEPTFGLYRNGTAAMTLAGVGGVPLFIFSYATGATSLNVGYGGKFASSGGSAAAPDAFFGRGGAAATIQRGAAPSATPVGQFATTQGGAGTNIAGADDVRTTSLGTGSATSGSTVERTGYPGASGTTAATPSSRSRLSGKWTPLTAGAATGFLDVIVPASGANTGEILVLIEANDGTEYQALGSRVRWSAATKATGNPVCTVGLVGTDLAANTSGTGVTTTFTVTAAAGKCTVEANAASDLTETTLRANVQVIGNGPGVTFTPLP